MYDRLLCFHSFGSIREDEEMHFLQARAAVIDDVECMMSEKEVEDLE